MVARKRVYCNKYTPSEDQRLAEMWREGSSTDQIAEELIRTPNSICYRAKVLDLPTRKGDKKARTVIQDVPTTAPRGLLKNKKGFTLPFITALAEDKRSGYRTI